MLTCITTEGVPGVAACTILGEHKVTCLDHPGWVERPGTCRGCLPQLAERGFLCRWCFDSVEQEVTAWPQFTSLLAAAEGRTVSPEAGGGSTPEGWSNLPLTFLAIDECERHLASLTGTTLERWVSTQSGARDAVQFARAASAARRSLQVEERETRISRARCDECGQLTVSVNPTREVGGRTVVECEHCGHVLDKIRPDSHTWIGSDKCSHGHHVDCERVQCRCDCHDLGSPSRRVGIEALFDGDMALLGWADRARWKQTLDGAIHRVETEKAA